MEISILNKFTWPFQISGLQNFSFSIVNEKVNSKYPSKVFCFIASCWIIYAFFFLDFVYQEFVNNDEKQNNFLSIVIEFLNFVNSSSAIFVAVILTLFYNSKLVNFFKKSTEVSKISFYEFNYNINFGEMKKVLYFSYFLNLTYFVALTQYLGYFRGSDFFIQFVKPTSSLIFSIFSQIIILRFSFYVRIVNFHLDNLCNLIEKHYNVDSIQKLEVTVKNFQDTKIDLKKRYKVDLLRRIFFLIKEMSEIINESMGFVILLRIFPIITNMIQFGYNFLSDIYGSVDTLEEVLCKFLRLFISLNADFRVL